MITTAQEFNQIIFACQNSSQGKLLPGALYIHRSLLPLLEPSLQSYEQKARQVIEETNELFFTLIKFHLQQPKVSYLLYPEFDTDPHPKLARSTIVDLEQQTYTQHFYDKRENPPILHRKETFVTDNYPLYPEFSLLTRYEVALGLLDNSHLIGTWQEWQAKLERQGIAFSGHNLICPLHTPVKKQAKIPIARHKAALNRKSLSRPVRLALEAKLFTPDTTFFDYGCGYGEDIKQIRQRGLISQGWDPYYYPDTELCTADIVNLGYVINVIEDLTERREALVQAWHLTKQVLIVAAQVLIDDARRGLIAYGDGIITSRNTFQKYYQQEELKNYIDSVLEVDAVPVSLGIYFVFRDTEIAESFRASRFCSQVRTPRVKTTIKKFADYRTILQPVMDFMMKRGRLPVKEELSIEKQIKAEFSSYRQAFKLILQATEMDAWQEIVQKRREDLKLHLALSRFNYRPSAKKISKLIREDCKALFGSYKQACLEADLMFYRLKDLACIADVARGSCFGYLTNTYIMIHLSALDSLPTLLRLYEGCVSRTMGRPEEANVIQIYYRQAKIVYLSFPDFDQVAHPILSSTMTVNLSNLQVQYRDYEGATNPKILHQKDLLVTPSYPLWQRFQRLTQQEKNRGLLDNLPPIIYLAGWLKTLKEHCVIIKGHSLYWDKTADSYKLKILKAQMAARQRQIKSASKN